MLNATLKFSLFHIDTECADKKRGKQVKILREREREREIKKTEKEKAKEKEINIEKKGRKR